MRRVSFSLAVLAASVYWADCGFEARVGTTAFNTRFAGCFKTTVGSPGFDELILVLEASAESRETLGGCLRRRQGNSVENGTVAGMVTEADSLRAEVTVTPPQPRTAYMLRVQRAPVGDVEATTVTLIDLGGAPFSVAVDMPRCSPQQTCAELRVPMPFLPAGVAP